MNQSFLRRCASPMNAALGLLFVAASFASAGPVVYTRPLPDANVNATPDSSRSNLAPIQNGTYVFGDDFSIAGSTTVDTLSVYIVSGTPNPSVLTPDLEYNISLFLAPDAGFGTSLSLVSSTFTFDPTPVYSYKGTGSDPNYYNVWKITFSGLNYSVNGGDYYDFAVSGTSKSPYSTSFALMGTIIDNAGANYINNATDCAGSAANCDGQLLAYTGDQSTGPLTLQTAFGVDSDPSQPAQDINVEITATPEPATFGFIAVGLIGLAYKRFRK